jgi:predicted nucleotidyltransferase component of viral defense system
VLANLCADIGAIGDPRFVLAGTLLRLCYFERYRYSADLDFPAVDELSWTEAIAIVTAASRTCRERVELPALEVSMGHGRTAWVTYVGPLASRPRTLKLDISDTELVETHLRIPLRSRWPDLSEGAGIEGYNLIEVAAEKLRCIAERLQCRDLYDLHELLDGGDVDALEIWELYLRKAANDVARGRQRTSPIQWAATFDRRLEAYRDRWDGEMADYLAEPVAGFSDIERRSRRYLAPVVAASRALTE